MCGVCGTVHMRDVSCVVVVCELALMGGGDFFVDGAYEFFCLFRRL